MLLVAYTNCSQQKFSFAPRDPFNPIEVLDVECDQVVVIPPPPNGEVIRVPARGGTKNICYSVKLVDGVYFETSRKNPFRDNSVISSDHDNKANGANNSHPFNLGQSVVNVILEGPRAIKLSGATSGTEKIAVDNFILVGVMPKENLHNPSYYTGYGTSDCQIYNVPGNSIGYNTPPYNNTDGRYYVNFNSSPVELVPFAIGGTANVDPFRIDGDMSTNRVYSIDFRALDCGGVGYSSDIYLTFN